MEEITGPFILPDDILIIPVSELSQDLKRKLRAQGDEFAITRPRSRRPSKLVDKDTAELLAQFRAAKPLVDAITDYGESRDLDPRAVLEEAFPTLQDLINDRVLVSPGTPEADRIVPSFDRGERVGPYKVLRCVQVLNDTELFQVEGEPGVLAIIKILRWGWTKTARAMLEQEAAVLRHLSGRQVPTFLDFGTADGLPYLAMTWCSGVSPVTVSQEYRAIGGRTRGQELLQLCIEIVNAYTQLHATGVIHGDVQPNNMLIDRDGGLTLVDFGLARLRSGDHAALSIPRGAVAYFLEPECAIALRAAKTPPDASEASEQYGVAALLYLLLTGNHYLDFALEREEALRQIAESQPLPFSRRGIEPWPEVEVILGRALSKQPENRFPSMAALGDALRRVDALPNAQTAATPSPHTDDLRRMLDRVLEQLHAPDSLDAPEFRGVPRVSLFSGSAGIAYALYRLACLRDDAALLCSAEQWLRRSEWELQEHSCYIPSLDITPETVGSNSPYHTATGLLLVKALISQAVGDLGSQREAVASFVAKARPFEGRAELLGGDAGVLLGSSLLLEALPQHADPAAATLFELGNETLQALWAIIDDAGAIGESPTIPYLGVAHGWAGLLYATLRWCSAAACPVPQSLADRLQELAAKGETSARGLRWPVASHSRARPTDDYFTSWCNGTPGFVYLWTASHRHFGDERFLRLAEMSAWNVWDEPNSESFDLCCGLGGHAYALLNVYKYTGDLTWLERARVFAGRAAALATPSATRDLYAMSLFKGEAGLAVLAADLAHPEGAVMPVFEAEGWPSPEVGTGQ